MVDFYGFHVGIYTIRGSYRYRSLLYDDVPAVLVCENVNFRIFTKGKKYAFHMQKKSTANFLHDSPCPSFIQLRYHPGRRNHGKPAVVSVSESRLLRRVFNT